MVVAFGTGRIDGLAEARRRDRNCHSQVVNRTRLPHRVFTTGLTSPGNGVTVNARPADLDDPPTRATNESERPRKKDLAFWAKSLNHLVGRA